jgi:hypothetical protein
LALAFQPLKLRESFLQLVVSFLSAITRHCGQQLKDPAQLDGWLREGHSAYVESLGRWS